MKRAICSANRSLTPPLFFNYKLNPVIKVKSLNIIGEIKFGKNNKIPTKIKKPYLEAMSEKINFRPTGKSEKSIFDPSSGGIGIRLNTAKAMFIITTNTKLVIKVPEILFATKILIKTPKINAMRIFESGPAKATRGSATFLFRRLYGLYGTGFAQPIMNPTPEITRKNGSKTEPNQSMCLSGFNVSLPSYCAVLSPKARAIAP